MKTYRQTILTFVLVLGGCYTTIISSGKPAGQTPVQYDDRWHHGFIAGLVEYQGNYDLDQICPSGWSEVRTETGFLNGLVEGITQNIYSPQSVWIVCSGGAGQASPSSYRLFLDENGKVIGGQSLTESKPQNSAKKL